VSRRGGRLLPGALLAVLALSACGLPVEQGVRSADPVAPEPVERGDIQVLPPGPVPGAGPRDVVLGFLGAQTSADDGHALAREFLAEASQDWDDASGAVVYDPSTLEVAVDPEDERLVRVRADTVATIAADGSYSLDEGSQEEAYLLTADPAGELRLAEVPSGLRLTPAGASRAFRPREVFFLGLPDVPRVSDRLVPDRVFLPASDEVDALVRRLLAGPSSALRGAVASAVPEGTELRAPVQLSESDGVVTVDLTAAAASAGAQQRRQLSAQLFWTLQAALPTASSLRLLVDGRPLDVPDAGPLQDRADWAAFDPGGAAPGGALYVEERRVRRLDGALVASEITDGRLAVDVAVASPASSRVAVITRDEDPATGTDVVRAGPAAGPFEPLVSLPRIRSLSWGSGERGLWIVAAQADPAQGSVVQLLPGGPGAPAVPVVYVSPADAGPLVALRISRDDARVAAVFGEGVERRLYVGRVEPAEPGLRLAGLRAVAPALTDVADVAWETGTSLVVLAPLGTPNRLPVRVAVDGSEVEPVRALGLDGEPETVAAAPGRPLVVGAVLAGRPVLLVEEGGLFRLQADTGSAPTYPG
jgi:hypothetical protein